MMMSVIHNAFNYKGNDVSNPLLAPVFNFAAKLRFPVLFGITAVLFVLDFFIPDFIPFVDEIILGLGALLFGSWKNRKNSSESTKIK